MKKRQKVTAISSARNWISKLSTTTSDGWTNRITGMGVLGKDKNEATFFEAEGRMDRETLDAIGRKDGIGRKIIHLKVDDAMRMGWTVTFKGTEENPVTPEESTELNERLVKWYKKVRFKSVVTMHLKQARQYGGSLLALGAMDGQKPDEPLNTEKLTEFSWVRAHDRFETSQTGKIEEDPTSKDFGFPESYFLYSTNVQISGQAREEQFLDTEVHASRVWRTDGVILSERVRKRDEGWGDSVLESTIEPLKNYNSGMKGSGTIIQDFMQGVYKVKDLQGIILANGDQSVRERFALMDFMKSIYNAIMIDADTEEYVRQTTAINGLPDLLDRHAIHLSAVADMPMTRLFGLSPSGFGTGEAEGDNWDDTVKAFQTDTIEPLLEYVLGILFQTPDFEDFPEDWSIKFTALQLTDPIEEADIRLKTSQADALDIQSSVLSIDEVAQSRYGGAAYSTETSLNEEARQMEAALLEAEGVAGFGEREALNGIQIASLLEILERVKTGVLPKDSAKVTIRAALPQLTPEEVQGMVDPIEVTGPLDPETGASLGDIPPQQTLPAAVAPTIPDGGGSGHDDDDEEEGANP